LIKIKKHYHAWLDISLGKVITQPMQRILLNNFVEKIGGKIIFELGEDVEFKESHIQLQNMVNSKINVHGFVFLGLEQFLINNKLNIKIIKEILKKKYELHFIKQQLSLYNKNDLKINFNNLLIYEDIRSA
jgi:hypothetical protein|tara:strand:+ start:271 stop:663 length:393 start_codon:yes stop_codon:yes gene_type:complete